METLKHNQSASNSQTPIPSYLRPQGVEDTGDEVPDDERMVDSPHEGQSDAWDKNGIAYGD
ncbi:MAG: hypothetical protein EOP06_19550 [Proteobacteria bacterium]|nr:MAG: hypothetical protein EOP06_19550 [Pseudomonadota bacterium]